jgi:hypothetical protein
MERYLVKLRDYYIIFYYTIAELYIVLFAKGCEFTFEIKSLCINILLK